MRKLHKPFVLLLCLLAMALLLAGCGADRQESHVSGIDAAQTDSGENNVTPEDYANGKIGIITGSAHDITAKKLFPDAQRIYFNAIPDMILAVEQGKLDCYLEDAPFLVAAIWEGSQVKRLPEPLAIMNNGFVFPQTQESTPLREEVNAFLAQAKADGTVDRLLQKWMADTEPTEHPDYNALTGENGTIRLAVCIDSKPLLYKNKDGCTGFEIELLTLFAQEYGYAFEIEEVPFESVLLGIATGKYDMAAAALNITAEREEQVDFSDPYGTVEVVMVVKDDAAHQDGTGSAGSTKTLADFTHAKIGVLTGSIYDTYAREQFPQAQRMHYSLMTDMLLAVEQGKIDGYIAENAYVVAARWEGAQVEAISEVIDENHAGFIFRKDDAHAQALRAQLDTFILQSWENGFLDALNAKWFGDSEPTEHPDFDALSGENGTIRIAAATDLKPVSYIKNGKLSGYEMELLWHFANTYGYRLDIATVTFESILPGVTTGKYDIGTGAISITPERAQSVDFSESHLTSDVVMAVKAQPNDAAQTGFWAEVKEDFHKTFVREDRWKLIVEGICVTVLISVCAIVAGTLLGFGLYMLSRSDVQPVQKGTRAIAKVYSRIVEGTPMVVILMILFYVVFGSFRDMSGIWVAIIGFTLTFGAFVYDHMRVSVNSVDYGQTEAAYALGYNKNKTFFRIIFPQAMTVFMPSYCGQAVDLVKATAVVGYIAVNDLTKMGDIIRSNTYEAFFPLITTALIYFVLTWMLSLLLGIVKRRFEPKRRSAEEILKGVDTL